MPNCQLCREILRSAELEEHECSTDLTCHDCGKVFHTPNGKDDHSHRKHNTVRRFPPVRRRRKRQEEVLYNAMGNLRLNDGYPSDSFLKRRGLSLDEYIKDNLQPNEDFHIPFNRDINALANLLKDGDFPFSVKEVIKGGSLGKGTGVRDSADADLVVFLNDFHSQEQFQRQLPSLLENIKSFLEGTTYAKDGDLKIERCTPHAIQFEFRNSNGEWHDVDLLPAYDIVGEIGKKAVHTKIKKASKEDREYYSAALVKSQVDYVKSMPTKVKDLIRLVKYWKKTDLEVQGVKAPASYAMELTTINAWKAGRSLEDFDMRKGFFQVLKKLGDYGEKRPQIKDPANPHNDVASRYKNWAKLGKVAEEAVRQPLFSDFRHDDNSWR